MLKVPFTELLLCYLDTRIKLQAHPSQVREGQNSRLSGWNIIKPAKFKPPSHANIKRCHYKLLTLFLVTLASAGSRKKVQMHKTEI